MALEAVVFSEGLFGCWTMPAPAPAENVSGGGMEGMIMDLEGGTAAAYRDDVSPGACVMMQGAEGPVGSSGNAGAPAAGTDFVAHHHHHHQEQVAAAAAAATKMSSPLPAAARRKRRRTRNVKNREEVDSQRMTHIAVERNRRKQMNEYLAVLRSLMPPSYVQRGDQASIIGGAINYAKELEQLLQSLEARKHARHDLHAAPAVPLAAFFTFPQYAMSAGGARSTATATTENTTLRPEGHRDGKKNSADDADASDDAAAAASGSRPSDVADIEVTMVESHANLKVLSRWRPRQVLRLVAGLQGHRLAVLHLNVTSAGPMALYSLSLKVEDDCAPASVDDIAAAVHRIVEAIEQEEQEHFRDGSCGERAHRLIGSRVVE
ncbi:transcription factor bHLH94-like isoform X2 [Miscanthus floridulus]|uniref:transcription factor bHLH94-like isoform X2 n=1 Tax=Miscanthus floridulus TaxID=154761 RepID=UPI0034587F6A